MSFVLRPLSLTLALLLRYAAAQAESLESLDHETQTFLTRPDIQVPRWNITVHDEGRLSPGYWFLAPIREDDQTSPYGSNLTVPMIIDQAGQLVWSGAATTEGHAGSAFGVSHVMGEDRLTFLYPRNRSLVVLDQDFTTFKQLETSPFNKSEIYNAHELNFVHHGTRALFFYDEPRKVKVGESEAEALGYYDEEKCRVREITFREADIFEDWRFVYRWSASKRIDLSESVATEGTILERCHDIETGWDFAHTNSVDKFDIDGSYLLSAKHTNTLYKVLRDGNIAWRLGGERSDFEADFFFSRQDHARILSYNDTHTLISFLDGADPAAGESQYARSMLMELRTDSEPKTARVLASYSHPDGNGAYVADGGSTQVLPNGNVFSGWVDDLLISEHDASGRLLMTARAEPAGLRSYRSYKHAFVGQPAHPPDVYAETRGTDDVRTIVYASWNGATEVQSWNVYAATSDGKLTGKPVGQAKRSGFETTIEIDGYVEFAVVEAIVKGGKRVGRSAAFNTVATSPLPQGLTSAGPTDDQELGPEDSAAAFGYGDMWEGKSWKDTAKSRSGAAGFVVLLAFLAGLAYVLRRWTRRGAGKGTTWVGKHNRRPSDYEMVDAQDVRYALGDDELGEDEEDDELDKDIR